MKRRTRHQGKAQRTRGKMRAALGLRAHSGWAALVVVTGSAASPAVIDRRRIEIADARIWGSKQPYHAAEGLDLKKAEEYLRRCAKRTWFLAREAVSTVINNLRKQDYEVVGCGLLLGSGRPVPTLAATLASHAMIHTAEGEFFRNALLDASKYCKLPVTGVKERELYAQAAAELGASAGRLQGRLAVLGRSLGPPWRQDQKYAALVGWLALAAASRR